MSFNKLGLIEPILNSLRTRGYTTPTPVQEKAIPVVLSGRDVLGCAQTGTGKTAAFAIPILQLLHTQKKNNAGPYRRGIKALVVTPTRELASQIEESFRAYGKSLDLKHLAIFGGVSQHSQVNSLRRGVDILITTPGRLLDLMNQRHVSLESIQHFVLDEADRMLDMGFINDVRKIISKLPSKKQTLFFSATMPQEVRKLISILLKEPIKIDIAPPESNVELIQQEVYFVRKHDKRSLLAQLLNSGKIPSALVFTRTKHGADKLAFYLHKEGIKAEVIHGNKSQVNRQSALRNFKTGRAKVLVATDIAARGIDINELTHVINFELPEQAETYVHRIGRTGRAGKNGIAISFCDLEEKQNLRDIQRLIQKIITVVKGHEFEWAPSQSALDNSNQPGRRMSGNNRNRKIFYQQRA